MHVRFKGGATKTMSAPRPQKIWEKRKSSPELVREIDRLLDEHIDAEIASLLNARGFRSGAGLPITGPIVSIIQRRYGLKSRYERLRERGMLEITEIAEKLTIFPGTARAWQKKGLLIRHEYTKHKYLFEPPVDKDYGKCKHFKNRPLLNKYDQELDKEVQYE
jgi:hypothetical protein